TLRRLVGPVHLQGCQRGPDEPELLRAIFFGQRTQPLKCNGKTGLSEKIGQPLSRTRPQVTRCRPGCEQWDVPARQLGLFVVNQPQEMWRTLDSQPEPVEQQIKLERIPQHVRLMALSQQQSVGSCWTNDCAHLVFG